MCESHVWYSILAHHPRQHLARDHCVMCGEVTDPRQKEDNRDPTDISSDDD